MLRHVVLPVDLSSQNERVFRAVQELVRPQEVTLTLLHVVETLRDVPFSEMEDFYEELRARAERTLTGWMEALAGAGFTVRCEVIYGARGRAIVQYAVDESVDLVVLRSAARDADHPAGTFGTLSHEVALLAPCSVLLVRESNDSIEPGS